MQQKEMLSRARMVAAVVSGTAKTDEKAQNVQVVAKLPIYHVAKLDALARQAGKNRTQMLSMLLAVGLEEVWDQLDEGFSEKLLEVEAQCMAELEGEA
jgi:hypothetical protein